MPVYEYECKDGHRFEELKPMKDFDALAACPECGKPSPRTESGRCDVHTIWKMAVHEDSGVPTNIHDTLTYKNQERFERVLSRQGKIIDPEDM